MPDDRASIPARALWFTAPRRCEIRSEALTPAEGLVRVRALASGISRGTEALVFSGRVPESEFTRMRGPHQGGDLPFPVKYGYAVVGQTDEGRTVFCLHPHQDVFQVPSTDLIALPGDLPPDRAVLAANMETALNIVWDAGVMPGDRVNVFGAGVVGLLVAHLVGQVPGVDLRVVEIDSTRGRVLEALGLTGGSPQERADVAINATAADAALSQAIETMADEGRVVEASWYGDRRASIPLGGAFHSRRLKIISSQVGQVAPWQRPRWPHRRRMSKALELLCDPRLDALISNETAFDEIAEVYGEVIDDPATLCHRIRY
ncbi:zinc-dependent alcohol dehydrogenase [Falsirhodobacter halotolerans]|uniref:zinc-dependent alcohol dehydrogenase n=1 Tax=Falsirhodobacter halotolerans TaxID=1146892 RepID=UPI001FD39DF1|nr:zinc-binding alcohol dehydrogenase [Falsirhodobacter halotolerans]MCJ8139989.1 zinc-binding alcohol dehydrogenase [Falsirhodobacter halotolerans]